jgi:hypothetical protein
MSPVKKPQHIDIPKPYEGDPIRKPLNCNSEKTYVFDEATINDPRFCSDQHVPVSVVEVNCRAICPFRRV